MDKDDLLTLRVQSLRQLRCASDHVRNILIPKFTSKLHDLRSTYFKINSTYFMDDVYLGQMMLQSDLAHAVSSGKRDPYYVSSQNDFKTLRSGRSNVGGFEVLHPQFIHTVADRTFSAWQNAPVWADETALRRHLAITDFLFQLAHFSKDGSGRSGEDFLALLGHVNGTPLTFSLTGYRAILGGENRLLFFRHLTERIGQLEFVRNFFLWLGIKPPASVPIQIQDLLKTAVAMNADTRQPRQGWSQDIRVQIDDLLGPSIPDESSEKPEFSANHPYRLYALFLAAEAVFLTLCLETPDQLYPELCARYPLSMACRELDLQDAGTQTYHIVSDGCVTMADDMVARLDLSRLNLAKDLEANFDASLAKLQTLDPYLKTLIDGERATAALEMLLSRAKVPLEPTWSAHEVRDAISRTMKWER